MIQSTESLWCEGSQKVGFPFPRLDVVGHSSGRANLQESGVSWSPLRGVDELRPVKTPPQLEGVFGEVEEVMSLSAPLVDPGPLPV